MQSEASDHQDAHGRLTVHVVERMAPGGVETLVLDMIGGLPGRHAIFSLSGNADQLGQAWPRLAQMCRRDERENGQPGKTSLEAFDRPAGISPSLVPRMARRLRILRPDVVIVHHIGPLMYGGLAARLARVPVVLHVEHDAWHYESLRRRQLAKALFLMVRPRRVAVSTEIADKVTRYFGGVDVAVVPPGIDMDQFRQRHRADARIRLGLPADVPLIGTSGRLVAVKNQIALIEALALLRRSWPTGLRPEVVLVGDGAERGAIEARAAVLGLAGAVHLLGHRDDVAEVLPGLDVFCLPSLNEGLPRAVLEAQAAGLPVVATRVGALADAVCPATGRLVPSGDVEALARALREVLSAPPDPARSRAFVADRFALTKTLAELKRLTQSLKVSHVGSVR